MSEPLTFETAPDVLTVEEGAQLARIGRKQMYAAIAAGEVPAARIGRTIRLSKAQLIAFLNGEAPAGETGASEDVHAWPGEGVRREPA
jgi:excisionase family DNA binding protein